MRVLFAVCLIVGCATAHHGPDGDYADVSGTAYDARLLMDGTTAQTAVGKSPQVPVTVTTRVTAPFGRKSETTIAVGGGYQSSAYRPAGGNLGEAVAASAAYRAQWSAANGGGATGGPVQYRSAQVPVVPTVPTQGRVSAGAVAVDPNAACPKGEPSASWTQAQLDACQNQAIGAIVAHRGVN